MSEIPKRSDEMKVKNILVTGGAGFLGSHLCKILLAKGHHVSCIDNLYTGRAENIADLLSKKNFSFIEHDIQNPLVPEGPIDEIYNLACPASPIHYQAEPINTAKTSILGALNMLELAREKNAKIFQASTSEVYGDPFVHPQPEDYWGNVNPIGIRSCYDEGKRMSETLFSDYRRVHGVNIKIVRIFNTYGPNMNPDDGRVVSNLIVQALNGDNLTIYGDGSQTRSFCFVDDLIRGFILMMDSNDSINGPINLGNPNEFTVLELATKILYLTNSNSEILFKDLPEDDPQQRKPDIAKAKSLLSWKPDIQLEEGLKRTIDYFKNLLKI